MSSDLELEYSKDDIKTLDWLEHMRLRPGMYIGKTGDGTSQDDGIYILLKEIMDNAIDEYIMGHGKKVEIALDSTEVMIRDFGRGIPLEKVVDSISKMNTSGKFDSKAFKKSVGMNGVGSKAVNALSSYFKVKSVREGKEKVAEFEGGKLKQETKIQASKDVNGTTIWFRPDNTIFHNYRFIPDYVQEQLWNYAYLNSGLKIILNGQEFSSKDGLKDLINKKIDADSQQYPIIHLKNDEIEMAFTHSSKYGEEYYSFVNGQFTTQGGTHLTAFKEAIVKTIRDFYKKDFDASDIRMSIVGAICVRIQEPMFESQTKTKLGTVTLEGDGGSMKAFVADFMKQHLDNFLHKNPLVAEALLKKIQNSERERKDMEGVRKIAKERAKKANVHNKKLRDCRYHYTDEKYAQNKETTIFITEGDSASGSMTKSRNAETQAVFSLKGKPQNCFGMKKKIVYENEELNLLQHALDIEEGIENLRYNNVIIATDADHDGMHIRLLLLTFFLQFFPELVINGHIKVLETPIFRVRNKKETIYCYSAQEKKDAMRKLGGKPEITRFKGLGEISPDEFALFIGKDMRLLPIILNDTIKIQELLKYYMGGNDKERQRFILDNLIYEIDEVEEEMEV
ncbi:MAG: toprim domain-containing protein [Chitinophagales bacterium]|nr:toprim domain-containing protein [Sphingobacteriales bacterium]